MSILLKATLCNIRQNVAAQAFSCSAALQTKQWRMERGLPLNRNAEGVLTDKPDYTYLDGRPTPLLHKQKQRLLKQQGIATRIVSLCSELEFAKQRYQNMQKEQAEERQKYIDSRLKPKGEALRRKH